MKLTNLFFRTLAFLTAASAPVLGMADVVSLDPRATFLRTNDDPGALDTVPINLSGLSFAVSPGDFLHLQVLGDWRAGQNQDFADTDKNTIGLFSSSNILLASSSVNRVPGAIDAGTHFVTFPTFFGGIPTDIEQDFLIAATGNTLTSIDIRVPVGGKFLFVAAHDSFYGDNNDPDGDYMLQIAPGAPIPEPTVLALLLVGIPATGVLAAYRKHTAEAYALLD